MLQVGGSVSMPIKSINDSYVLTDLDYTVIFTGASTAPTFTLPDPASCKGRMHHLVNASSGATYKDITLSRSVSLYTGNITTVLSTATFVSSPTSLSATNIGNTALIQSDGIVWWRIGL